MRWIKRILAGAAGLVLFLVILLAAAVVTRPLWQKNWVPPDNGIDLTPKWQFLKLADVPPDSAFDYLRRAAEAESRVVRPPELQSELRRLCLEPWSDQSFPVLAKMLVDGREAMQLARSAAAAPNPQMPTYTSLADSFPYISPIIQLNDLFLASAAQKLAAGNSGDAFADLETSLALAQTLSRGGVLIHVLVEIVIETRTYRVMRLIALQNELPPKVAADAIDRLYHFSRTMEPLGETFRAEYRAIPTTVRMVFNPADNTPLGFNFDKEANATEHRLRLSIQKWGWLVGSTPPEVTADLASVYKSLVKTADGPYRAADLEWLTDRLVEPMKPRDWILARDPVGYMLTRLTLPTIAPIITRYYRRAVELNATAAVIGLRQYEQAVHHPPASLNELVPKYLPGIPHDPFDSHPLRYRVRPDQKWIVYSIGPDQIDNGGEQPKVEPRRPGDIGDIVFCQCEPDTDRDRLRRTSP